METTEQPCHGTGIMVFRPTIEEFADFSAYIQKMEDCGAHKFGIAKVNNYNAVKFCWLNLFVYYSGLI